MRIAGLQNCRIAELQKGSNESFYPSFLQFCNSAILQSLPEDLVQSEMMLS
jgi:hypothetical protein